MVRVGVGCFVTRETASGLQILIGKRKGSHGTSSWQLPGGHLEFNETFEECAKREVLEETNLEVDQLEFLTATNDIMPQDNKHYVTIFMRGRAKNPDQVKVMEPEKLDGEWNWVYSKDLESYTPLFVPLQNLIATRQTIIERFGSHVRSSEV